MNEIIFVVEDAPEGGLMARTVGESIFTQAPDMAALHSQVRDAVRSSSTAPSPASGKPGPMPTSRPTTRSSRGSRARWLHQRRRAPHPASRRLPGLRHGGRPQRRLRGDAALYHRQRTGEGQFIDVALLDSIMPLMGWVVANLLIGGHEPPVMGNDNFTAAPSGTFKTRDGHVNIAANKQEQWEALCDVLGVAPLKADPHFQERDERKKNRHALTPLLEAKLKEKPTPYWLEALNARDVPSGDILR